MNRTQLSKGLNIRVLAGLVFISVFLVASYMWLSPPLILDTGFTNNTALQNQTTHRRPLVFVKIPKTGGSTVACILLRRAYYGGLRILNPYPHYRVVPSLPKNRNKTDLDLIANHILYRPQSINLRMKPNPIYITFVREPVARMVSTFHYFYATRFRSFADWLGTSLAKMNGRVQTDWSLDPMTPQDMTLDHFDFVGLTENMSLSIFLMGEILGLGIPEIVYLDKKVNPEAAAARQALTADEIEKIKEFSFQDLRLYEEAKNRFQLILTKHDGPEFQAKYQRYRREIEEVVMRCDPHKNASSLENIVHTDLATYRCAELAQDARYWNVRFALRDEPQTISPRIHYNENDAKFKMDAQRDLDRWG